METRLRPHWICLAGTILVVCPYISVLLDPTLALLFRDLSNVWLPYKSTWITAVSELGRIPHWDPLHSGGSPFLADPNYGPLYPLNWLLFPLSQATGIARALTYFIVLHHMLVYLGHFLLLRSLRVRPALCLLGGLGMAWAGPVMSSDNLLHDLCSQASVGFFFLFWGRSLKQEAPNILTPNLFASSLALAWPIYGGNPQYTYLMGIFAGCVLLFHRAAKASLAKNYLLLTSLTGLVAAPQWLPSLHYLNLSERMADASLGALVWSLHPLRLLESIFPLAFGPSPLNFWASHLVNGATLPFIFSLYVGAQAATFSLLHLCLRIPLIRRRSAQEIKRAVSLLLFLFLVLLCFGDFAPLPLYKIFSKVLPLWQGFRYPERLSYWLVLAIGTYGFVGAEKLLRLRRCGASLPLAPVALTLSLLGLCFGTWLYNQGASLAPVVRFLAFCLFLLFILWYPRWSRYQAWIFLALFLADMLPIARQLVWAQPASFADSDRYSWAKKILADKNKQDAASACRFFSLRNTWWLPAPEPDRGSGLDSLVYSTWAGMQFNVPSAWGIPLVRSHTSMTLKSPVLQLVSLSPQLVSRALDLYSTRYILVEQSGKPVVLVNDSALPLLSFPTEIETFSSEAALAERLRSPLWNPQRSILVETDIKIPQVQGTLDLLSFQKSWDRITISARARTPSSSRWLLLNESFDHQWRAQYGVHQLSVERANGWAMAILLPALETNETIRLELAYRDNWYIYGQWGLVLWLLLFAMIVAIRLCPKALALIASGTGRKEGQKIYERHQ